MEGVPDELDDEILHLLESFDYDLDSQALLALSPPRTNDGRDVMFMYPQPAPVNTAPPASAVESEPERVASDPSSGNRLPHFGGAVAYDGVTGAVVFTPSSNGQHVAPSMAISGITTNFSVEQTTVPAFQKTGLALQRERTGNLQLEDLAPCFHLPISDAATRLNLCTTALKKACRRNGIPRWPYRKVKSTDAALARLLSRDASSVKGSSMSSPRGGPAAASAKVLAQIDRLHDERAKACEGWEGRFSRCMAEIRQLTDRLRGEYGEQAAATRAKIDELYAMATECQTKGIAMRSKRAPGDN